MVEEMKEKEVVEGIEIIEEVYDAEDMMFGRCPASSRCCK